MFKKIEIWILYLTILLSILFAIAFGALVRHEIYGGKGLKSIGLGWFSETALFFAEIPSNAKNIVGYINANQTEDRFPSLDWFDGTPNSEESYLLLSRYDGDLQEGIVELIDLTNFQVLHAWNPDINAFNNMVEQVDEFKNLDRDENNKRSILLHPNLDSNGGLLFQNSTPLRKIDACSNLVFQNTHDRFHHSIERDIDGNIWVPSFLYPQSISAKKVGRNNISYEEGGFLDDAIVKLSPDGEILFKKSISQIFIDNGLQYLLFAHGNDYEIDPIHQNDIQPVNFDGEFWDKGDIFISIRNQSMIMLYRPSTNEIIWKGTGPFLHQHDVDILDNHRISVFNNRSINVVNDRNIIDGSNEVIIYNFKTGEYSSYLKDYLIKYDVRTITGGRSEILTNGNLFIEETDYGRSLYLNADGSLRWTHVNRADNGNVYRVGWSRILYTKEDIQTVNSFLANKGTCNE